MSAQFHSIDADDVFVSVSFLTPYRVGQIIRRGNHHYKVLSTKCWGLIATVEYYKPWSHR
jgi:hypothetical protein